MKHVRDEAVERFPILQAVVVPRVEIDVRAEAAGVAVEREDRTRRHQQRRLRVVRPETAVVARVVADLQRIRRDHRGQMRVIRVDAEIHRRLLGVAEIHLRETASA